MVTLSQRIEELRTQRNLSRPALAAALSLPRTAVEKFETGRQTPTREQQEQLAAFFGVSVFYLRGESSDPTRQDAWLDGDFTDDTPAAPAPKKYTQPPRQVQSGPSGGGAIFDTFAGSRAFQDAVRAAVLDVLRSPEGQNLLIQSIRKELSRMK